MYQFAKWKKGDELCRFFIRYQQEYPKDARKLVLIGVRKVPVVLPADFESKINDLGIVPVGDKHNAFSAAEFLRSLSHFERFSLLTMENWLTKRPFYFGVRISYIIVMEYINI